MKRRVFIAGLGAAAAVPILSSRAALAQQPIPLIGFMSDASLDVVTALMPAFHGALKDSGYVEGHSVRIEYRWVEGQFDRIPGMAADLVARKAAVIVTSGGGRATLAAKAMTSTVPIVFTIGTDPVKAGLVASLNRPGGNLTGVTVFSVALEPKRLEVLRELVPSAAVIAVLLNPNFIDAPTQVRDLQAAARTMGQEIAILNAGSASEIDAAFETIIRRRADAILICSDPFLNSRRRQIVALAARHAVPAIYQWRDHAAIGGLMSYGTSLSDAYRQIGTYAGRILKGEKPADLPVVQATRVELVINLKTAKALGLAVPPSLLARADEVIE